MFGLGIYSSIRKTIGRIPGTKPMYSFLRSTLGRSAGVDFQKELILRLAELQAEMQKTNAAISIRSDRDAAFLALVSALERELHGRLSAAFVEHADLVLRRQHEAEASQENILRVIAANMVAQRTAPAGLAKAAEPLSWSGDVAARYLDLVEDGLTEGSTLSGGIDTLRRAVGRDWPQTAVTMIGRARMRNLRHLLTRAIVEKVPGDVIETGVWRGGACIYMRAILAAHGDPDRRVFVADSFKGLPPPDEAQFPPDAKDKHHTFEQLAISREEVEVNFRRYDLLDERVVFLEGWFKDTLPKAPIEKLAILRLDGDMYESTIQALHALYHKVSPGGFVIVDDYVLPPCAKAVDDFRTRHGIMAPLQEVDGAAVWWRVP